LGHQPPQNAIQGERYRSRLSSDKSFTMAYLLL